MMDILEEAKDVLHQEAQGIEKLIPTLNQNFVNAVNMIMKSKGRVIVTGMGKSGHIARKVSATLSSTGTPSIFLHPAEAIHGDLGMVTADDVVLAFSNSGETVEILNILPSLKRIGAKLITVVGNHNSTLAKYADISNKNRASLQAKMEYDRRRDRHLREQGVTEIVHVFYEDLLRPINLETKLLKAGVPKIR